MTLVEPLETFRRNESAWRFEGRHHAGGAALSFFLTTFAPGDGPPLHLHPYAEVFLVEEGEATFTVDGSPVVVEGGNVVVVPGDTPHAFVNSGGGTLRVISMQPSAEVVQTDL
jgi:quercetin dioxygenase-like cupin family protein